MGIIIFLFMNCIVAAGAFTIVYKLFRAEGLIDSLICWFIVYLAQILSTEILLGVLGILRLKELILLNLFIMIAVLYISRGKEVSFRADGVREGLGGIINNKAALLGLCAILSFAAVKLFINLVNPPFGWDSINYHFTFPVEWLKHANLGNPMVISDDPSPAYYPIGGSLFYFWLIAPLKSVFLADLGQAPFFILAFLSVYGISRKLELGNKYSFYAAALFFIIPNFFKQLQIAYVDVMVAALFLSSLNILLLLNREFSLRNALLFGFSLGLFLSVKTVSLPYAALLFLPFLFLSVKKRARPHIFLISTAVVAAIGGFSYIKNFIETGNPLYPLALRLSGITVFKGVIDSVIYRAHFKPEDYRLSKLLFHEGLGVQSILFVLPSVFLALPVAVVKMRRKLNAQLAYLLVLPLLIYLLYRYAIPLANSRYLYPMLGIGMVCGFYTVKMMNIPGKIVNAAVIICILSSMSELAKRQELVISLLLTCALFLIFLLMIKRGIKPQANITVFVPFFFSLAVISLFFLHKDYRVNEYPRYTKMVKYSGFWPDATRAWEWMDSNTGGDNIAYVGRPVPFPLYGSNFKNNVYYVSVNTVDPVRLHYFPASGYEWGYDFLELHRNFTEDGNYREKADYPVWMDNLLRRDTDYLFVYSLHQTKELEFPLEDKWAMAHPERFIPAFTNQSVHIYKVIK